MLLFFNYFICLAFDCRLGYSTHKIFIFTILHFEISFIKICRFFPSESNEKNFISLFNNCNLLKSFEKQEKQNMDRYFSECERILKKKN